VGFQATYHFGGHPMTGSTRLAATAAAIDASYQAGDVAPPDGDDRGVTTITALSAASERPNAGGFSRRELLAHTDGSGVPTPPALMMLALTITAGCMLATHLRERDGCTGWWAARCPISACDQASRSNRWVSNWVTIAAYLAGRRRMPTQPRLDRRLSKEWLHAPVGLTEIAARHQRRDVSLAQRNPASGLAMTSDRIGSGRRQFLGHRTLAVLIDTGTGHEGKAVALIEPDSSRVIGLYQEQ
jgi:hypothetical protein